MRLVLDSLDRLTALALPPRCPGCAVPVERDHRFCATCWNGLRFILPPWCAACNAPFEYDRGEGALCAACLVTSPRHGGVRAAVAYGSVAKRLALRLKYGGRIGIADTMAGLMARGVPPATDLLVPVPLHRWRLWGRGFNQAALIAAGIARRTGARHDATVLVRARRTPALRGLGAGQRRRAVAGAFRVRDVDVVRGRTIVLVDDVYTTGATANACAAVLLRAGAAQVTIACWARVIGGDPDAAETGRD